MDVASFLCGGAVAILALAVPAARGPADDPPPAGAVTFAGRVVEAGDQKPIADAAIVVNRSLLPGGDPVVPAWVGETTLRTDAEGRFALTFPPEQVAERRLLVTLARVAHPDFVARKGRPVPLADLLQGQRHGDRPFFETIALDRGIEYHARVVQPDGKAAVDVPFELNYGAMVYDESARFLPVDGTGRTDADGRLRLRLPRNQGLLLVLRPDRFVPFTRSWNPGDPADEPVATAATSADLGTMELKPGLVLAGRVLDQQGRPIAGQPLTARGRQHAFARSTTTDDEGRFAFPPLQPGNYYVYGRGQDPSGGIDPAAPITTVRHVLQTEPAFLAEGREPRPVTLREIPSVRVAIRYVDSRGATTWGGPIHLFGILPRDAVEADKAPMQDGFQVAGANNGLEAEMPAEPIMWTAVGVADAQGLVEFRAPLGLKESQFQTLLPDETVAYKVRLAEGGPLRFGRAGELGTLDADRAGVEIVSYRSPTALVTAVAEDGPLMPREVQAGFGFVSGEFSHGENAIRQADGRFRLPHLMPGQEYEVRVNAPGRISGPLTRFDLPEGGESELTIFLRRRPEPPAVGEPAPPFLFTTTDGRAVALPDYQGKYVLVHAWPAIRGRDDPSVAAVRDVHRKFAGAGRLAFLSLCFSADEPLGVDTIAREQVTWPVAIVRDRVFDPIVQDFGIVGVPSAILIGPDGRIVARDLGASMIEKAVAKALDDK